MMDSLKTAIIALLAAATAALAIVCYQQNAAIWILKNDLKNLNKEQA